MNTPIIEFKNINFSYDQEDELILKNVCFSINEGEYVCLIGHNGSGKSTIAKLLCGLLNYQDGEILINGIKLNDENLEALRKDIGIVFQNPDNQFIGSTVEDDIAFGLENRCIEREKMISLIHDFSKRVGMENFLSKQPEELSGGQKQRVAIAGILALDLKIIIFDEATSMLDPQGVEEIRKLVFDMRKKDPKLTFISITHDMEEAYLADKVICLKDGEIFFNDTPENVFKHEEELNSIGLGLPFIVKIKNDLLKHGIKIDENIKNIEDLAGFLCK